MMAPNTLDNTNKIIKVAKELKSLVMVIYMLGFTKMIREMVRVLISMEIVVPTVASGRIVSSMASGFSF